MSQNRFSALFGSRKREKQEDTAMNLRGFIANPLVESMTLAQALMYQAAFEQAQKALEKSEWRPFAECWN